MAYRQISVQNLEIVFLIVALSTWNDFWRLCHNCNNINQGALVDAAPTVRGNDWSDLFLTQIEKEKLDLFKTKVAGRLPESYMNTDFYLVRWLRARNFDVDKAWTMLHENLKWRQENKMANILSEDFSDVADQFPMTTDTHDKKYRPVGTVNFGVWDVRLAAIAGKLPRLSRLFDRFMEQLVQQIFAAQQSGKQVTRTMLLYDLEGFSYQNMCPSCMPVYIRLLIGLESHYPGFCEEIIFVNAPSVFSIFLNAVKAPMSKQTRDAIKTFGSNKEQWGAYLRERIESDQLYQNFGGTKEYE